MKYYKYSLLERHGDMEASDTSVIEMEDDTDLEKAGHQIAMENRGSDPDDYDEYMDAYWRDCMVTFVPGFEEISKAEFDVLKKHL